MATSRRGSDVRSAYANLTNDGLRSMGEQVVNESAYSSNEFGHFAWDVSLMIRAACLAWRYSGDLTHLGQAAAWSQHILERTDKSRNRSDWRGRSGPVWSSGSRYTAGIVDVGSFAGLPVTIQAAASTVKIERPRADTAIIHAVREDGSSWTSPEASVHPASHDYLPDVLARKSSMHSVLVRGLAAPIDLSFLQAGEYKVVAQHAAHLVHTGMIARALIEAADTLENAGKFGAVGDVATDELYLAAREALTHHDDELRIRQGQPWYFTPEDFPGRRLAVSLPHNHVSDVATSFLLIGRRDSDASLQQLGAALTQPWIEEIYQYESGALLHPWFYYPQGSDASTGVSRTHPIAEREVAGVPREEDSSHATIRVRALYDWYKTDPSLVKPEVLRLVGGTLEREFITRARNSYSLRWLPQSSVNAIGDSRLGHADSYPGAWGKLAPWSPNVRRIVSALAFRKPPERIFGATLLSAAEITALNTRMTNLVRSRVGHN